jgi:SSS family transporter
VKHLALAGILTAALVGSCSSASAGEAAQGPNVLEWGQLPPLPDPIGFAGSFAGVSGDALIVAGGANFPDGRPWNGAAKVWHDRVFVLADPKGAWKTGFRLPRPLGYGVSLTWQDEDGRTRVICLGGGDAERHYRDVFLLQWTGGNVEITELPPMPGPAAFFSGAIIDQTIYVAGGRAQPESPQALKTFWALDLSKKPDQRRWEKLDPWPGEPRMLAVAAVQGGSFFLVDGVTLDPDKEGDTRRVYLDDGYRYDPATGNWTQIAPLPRYAAAAPKPAIPLGQSHFAIVGGDDGTNAFRVDELKDNHPGFPADVLCYHLVTDTWVTAGQFPKDPDAGLWPPVTTNTTCWEDSEGHDRYVIPSGEVRPGVRTPKVAWAKPAKITRGFGALDYGVLVVYLAALVAMGVYFSRREKSTGDFFLGGHRIPWWAAGLSIFGTQLSAITFMSIPAKSFRTNWTFFLFNMMIVVMAPVVVFFYLPFYRRLGVTSAYEYLEKRFNKATRLLGSASFVLFQLGRMGVVLFLPALALSTVTGINVYACIVVMGVLATLYTVLGGIEAVVWTDVLQVFVLLGGALVSLVIIALKLSASDGGLAAAFTMVGDADKLRLADLDWPATEAVLWVIVVGAAMQILVSYTGDQTVVQRYLTTKDEKSAARSIWTNALLTIPASLIFFGVGTALWAFYKTQPELLNPTGTSDDIFPWFIAQQLPVGVAGLVIAGLFAAAMSSLDSSMNSMATAIITDFYCWFHPTASDRHLLRVARVLTLLLGILGTGSAVVMAILNSPSMWDQYMKVVGLFGGGLAGLFALGIFTRRANAAGAIVGLLASAAVLYWVATANVVHGVLYAAVGIAACFAIGYAVSLLLPGGRRDLGNLTVFTLGGQSRRTNVIGR